LTSDVKVMGLKPCSIIVKQYDPYHQGARIHGIVVSKSKGLLLDLSIIKSPCNWICSINVGNLNQIWGLQIDVENLIFEVSRVLSSQQNLQW
jgi:hypothetical protein